MSKKEKKEQTEEKEMQDQLSEKEQKAKKEEEEEKDIVEKLKEENEKLSKEVEKYKDKWVRTIAEFENFRKRNQKERVEWIKNANKELIKEFIDVLENMELARKSSKDKEISDEHKKGFEMVYEQFKNILQKHGLEKIDTVGHEFNPKLHEALIFTENDEYNENIIFDCISNGYFLNDQVLRHAKVAVSKGPKNDENNNNKKNKNR